MRKGLFIGFFLGLLALSSFAQRQIKQYEYWFDANYSAKKSSPVTLSSTYMLTSSFLTKGLPEGLHTFIIRFQDNEGAWSVPVNQFFVKIPVTSDHSINKYEYWFDDNTSGGKNVTLTAKSSVSFDTSFGTNSLPEGLHTFQIRFQDNSGSWSPVANQFFVKTPIRDNHNAIEYEYWFDNGYTGKTKHTITANESVSLITSIASGSLTEGLHTFQIRFRDKSGAWSVVANQFFIKTPVLGDHDITEYEYWFDNKYTNKVKKNITKNDSISLISSIATDALVAGLHTFQIRFHDKSGAWSVVANQFFIKTPVLADHNITEYEYWFDNNYINKVKNNVTENDSVSLISSIATDTLVAGSHTFQIRFHDKSGAWSVVANQSFVIKAEPIITWATPGDIIYGTTLSDTQLNATFNVVGTFVYNPVTGTKLNVGSGQTLSVQFTPVDTVNYKPVSKTVQINVVKPSAVITWDSPKDITYGTALSAIQLNATANISGTFTYKPSIDAILNAGTAQTLQVIFTPTDAVNYQTSTKTVQINVNKKIPVITWDNPADIIYGTTLGATQLNAITDVLGTFTYNPVIGTKLALGSGQSLSVQFNPTDVANFQSVSKIVKINVLKPTAVLTWSNPADITYGTALSSTQLNATANVSGTFTYKPSLGVVLNAGVAQLLQVTFTPSDAVNYASTSKLVQINVKKKMPVITWTNPTDIIYGSVLSSTQLNATADVLGAFTYNPGATKKLDAGSALVLSANFVPIDTVNFEVVNKTVQINVKKATPVTTWTNPADMYLGDALSSTQLNATANVAGTFTYSPAIGTRLSIGNGQTLSTQFKATDEKNYELTTKQVSVNVIQAVLSVSTVRVNISFTGRETFTLTINSNSPWVATSDQTWLTLSSSSGTGDATIILSTTENNTDFDRTAIITIKGSGGTVKTISVTQSKNLQKIANITRKWNDVLVCNNSDNLFIDYQWYKNDVSIIGETKQYYQELGGLNGNYYVKVTTYDGTIGISNTINDVSKASKSIRAYPNPTQVNQNFSLEIKASESDLKQSELTISSVSGQVIFRDNNLQQQMQLNGLSRGCYIIQIRLKNGELLSEKLMVN